MSLTILDFEEGAVDVGVTTVSVGASTTEGRLLVGGIAIDKDSGSVPSPSSGWTLLGGDHSASVSCALAVRVADGSGTGGDDHLTWTWDDPEEPTAWIGEFDNWEDLGSLDDLSIQVSEHFTTESSVTSLAMGPVVAAGDGAAITQLAIDSAENWSGDSYTNGFAEQLDAGFAAGVEVRYLSGVAASSSVETTSTTTGAGDQVSGMLVVISGPDPVTAWCGAVTTDGATVVAKVPAIGDDARLVVSTESDLSTPVYSDPVTVDELGLARLTIDELAADTGYYYGLEVDSVLLDDGRGEFSTMPAGAASFSFAHGSCWNPGAGPTPTWDRIAASGARFMVELGDFGYPDEFDGLSVNGLRANYTKIGSDPDLAPLMALMPWAYTFCDHDSGGEGAWSGSSDLPNAQQVYRERVAHYPLDDEHGIYQTFVCGRARFVLLDTRSFRDQHTDTDDANKTMLGAAQLAWLESVLEADNSRVIFLISSVPWNDPTTGSGDGDGWGRYNTERTALISLFTSLGVLDRLYIVCGDAHMVAADDGTNSPGGIPTVQAAPLGHEPSIKGGTFSEGSEAGSTQYGLITVTDPGGSGDVTVDFAGYDDDGEIAISMETVFTAPEPPSAGVLVKTSEGVEAMPLLLKTGEGVQPVDLILKEA